LYSTTRFPTYTTLDSAGSGDYRSVVGFFARHELKNLRLVGGYDVLHGKLKTFMREH
jgi:type III restriction enzyme